MAAMASSPHILVFPYPAQGHMLALLDLTHHLSLHGLTITVLITLKNLPILSPLLSSNPSIQTLVLPFPSHPSIPPGVENVKDIGNHGNIPIMSALSRLQDDIFQWFKSHDNPPVAILSDFFLGWTYNLANRIGIPRIVFYSEGAILTAVLDSLWADPEGVKPESEIRFHELPREPGFTWHQLPSLYQRYRGMPTSDPNYKVISTLMSDNASSWASVFNSFDELQDEFLEYWIRRVGHRRVYCVGPLNMRSLNMSDELSGGKDRVISWLDQRADNGVLYVCFGSQKLLKKPQMEALAMGLERSGVQFVWAYKPPTTQQLAEGYGSAPEEFKDRVSDRGLIIEGWAPQTAILSHRAVGGFLSHCGWNSVLEAIAAGVMILGWPLEADQFVNAKLLVEYNGAAMLLCEGDDTVPDSNELARKINKSMQGDTVERFRAKELRDRALEATRVGGASNRDLERLVQEIANLKV